MWLEPVGSHRHVRTVFFFAYVVALSFSGQPALSIYSTVSAEPLSALLGGPYKYQVPVSLAVVSAFNMSASNMSASNMSAEQRCLRYCLEDYRELL